MIDLLGGIRATVFAAVAAVALAAAGVQSWRLGQAHDALARASAEIAVASAAAAANIETINKLRAANRELAAAVEASEVEAERAAARLEKERARLAGELERERRRRIEIYQGDSHAKDWSVTAVPAAVFGSLLRSEAAGSD